MNLYLLRENQLLRKQLQRKKQKLRRSNASCN
jgi:hypothetical protein